jgi:hypothetical protein
MGSILVFRDGARMSFYVDWSSARTWFRRTSLAWWRSLLLRRKTGMRQAILDTAARNDAEECQAARRRLLDSMPNDGAVGETQALPQTGPRLTSGGGRR